MPSVSEERWRRVAFERVGPDRLRLQLETRRTEFNEHHTRSAEAWLREKEREREAQLREKEAANDRRERARFETMRSWTIAATMAGIIAAIAGVIAAIAAAVAAWRSCFLHVEEPKIEQYHPQPVPHSRSSTRST
jgi:hypothetical protein